ncbi:50S ribosomal protein L25/general stress protein Ctc [soil metagenome]
MAKAKAHAANNLIAEVRDRTGKGASRQARRDGKVPAVLYGHGTEPQHLTLPARELSAVLRNFGTNAVLTLDIAGTEALALPKQLEIHPIKRNIQHVDLIIVRRGEKVNVEVNVLVEGNAQPGALVTQETNAIEIESDAMSIPEQLTLSIEGVAAGTQITAADIELPEGTSLISDPELRVVNIVTAPT